MVLAHGEAEELPEGGVDRYVEVRILEIDGGHPSLLWNERKDGLEGCHPKLLGFQEDIESYEVHYWPNTSILFGNKEIFGINTSAPALRWYHFDGILIQ